MSDDSENETASGFAWPYVARKAFEGGEDWWLNACVGWVRSRPHDMIGYVEGYRRAATALYDQFVSAETRSSPDFIVFPLAFLWRQHLELALKEIIAVSRQLRGEEWGFPRDHHLLQLWHLAKPEIVKHGDKNSPELRHVEANIREFERIDPGSDGFRYPVDKDQTGPSLPNAPEYVNLRVMHEAMEALANFFSGVRSTLGLCLDSMNELETAIRADYDEE